MAPRRQHHRRVTRAIVAGLSLSVAGALALTSPRSSPAVAQPPSPEPPAAPVGLTDPPPPLPAQRVSRADAAFQRDGRSPFSGGYLAITPDFSSPDGVYDVVVHFHGNTELVEQSLAYAGIGAVFVPQNYGVGSAPYEGRFAAPGSLTELLGRVQAAMERRGLAGARLGRVALVAWSAGHGAVRKILEREQEAERVDTVILLDGLHIGRVPGQRRPAVDEIAPYERFARWATEGRKLFVVTHSEIAPDGFVGAHETTDVLLARLGVLRYVDGEEATVPPIPAAEGVLSKELRRPLQPLTMAGRGRFVARGYAGDGPEHHVYHLLEMASIALPDLARWWARSRDASP